MLYLILLNVLIEHFFYRDVTITGIILGFLRNFITC